VTVAWVLAARHSTVRTATVIATVATVADNTPRAAELASGPDSDMQLALFARRRAAYINRARAIRAGAAIVVSPPPSPAAVA